MHRRTREHTEGCLREGTLSCCGSLRFHHNPMGQVLLLPFHRQENRNTEKFRGQEGGEERVGRTRRSGWGGKERTLRGITP